jgi:hypothetical protein
MSKSLTIDIGEIYLHTGTAKLADLPIYEAEIVRLAGSGNDIILTGKGPVWMYLRIAHALHGVARTLTYSSPVSGPVRIFDHTP